MKPPYPPYVETRALIDQDPEWAHTILEELYYGIYNSAQRKLSDQGILDGTPLHEIDVFGPNLETKEITASVIRGVARRLDRPMPPALQDPTSGVLRRLVDSGPEVASAAVHEAKMDFQRPSTSPQVRLRVTRDQIIIDGILPHKVSYQ